MELTAVLIFAAPVAVWTIAAWTTAASGASGWAPSAAESVIVGEGRSGRSEPRSASTRTDHVRNMLRSVVGAHDGFPVVPAIRRAAGIATASWPAVLCGLAERLTTIPARQAHGLKRLAALAGVDGAAGPEGDPPARPAAGSTPLLTPPDFGAPPTEDLVASCPAHDERRFLIRTEDGRQVVARLHGHHDGKSVLMLPDGWLGIPSMLVPTEEPFRPMTADEMVTGLQAGAFADFGLHRTEHYLILYQSADDGFAKANGVLLEDLYRRLLEAFRKHEVTVHEAEFPMVAVIFRTEDEFRAYRPVAPDVQAYYEVSTNRILLYDQPSRERIEPEVNALLKPQMVAHEGTHQILQNIGVHPRLSNWPLWLVEGLAEYCATPASSRKGAPAWDGLGRINNLHMATLREVEDPVSLSMRGQDVHTKSLFRKPGQPLVEAMIRRHELTPTEYALAWAITHYLAMKRSDDFTRFLRVMAAVPPLEPRSADDHVRDFRQAFGDDLGKLDKTIHAYLSRLTKQKGYDPMPYYAVLFEQPLANGRLRRAAMVSQSPQLIKQWVDEMSNPIAGLASWQATPFPSRGRATLAIQDWIRSE
ncbi:hypothetical protein VT85_17270 [Planctomyces sp. SH-PL62]|nr:hypothetical protein VT85_17270 [Planctomyces sp. SH-PL62]